MKTITVQLNYEKEPIIVEYMTAQKDMCGNTQFSFTDCHNNTYNAFATEIMSITTTEDWE